MIYAYPVVGSTVRNVGAWGRDNWPAIDCGRCIEHAAQVELELVGVEVGPGGYE